MTAAGHGFSLEGGDVLEAEPRAVFEDGVVYAAQGSYDGTVAPLMNVSWLHEPAGAVLDDVVDEDCARMSSRAGSVLVDREPTAIGGVECVRTYALHLESGGRATAAEQWRLLAAGRRWTVTALTALDDQPLWGPRLAAIAATFRVA